MSLFLCVIGVHLCSWNYDVSYDIGVKVACKTDFGLKFSLVFNLVYWEKYDELKRAKFQPALCTSRTCNEDYFCSMNIRFRITWLNIRKWPHTKSVDVEGFRWRQWLNIHGITRILFVLLLKLILQVGFNPDEISVSVKEVCSLIFGNIHNKQYFKCNQMDGWLPVYWFNLSALKASSVEQIITRVKSTSGRPV